MRYEYKIDKNLVLQIWDKEKPNEEMKPFLEQPYWPDGTQWADKAQAENWAKAYIEALANPNSEFVAGNSPDKPELPRPVKTSDELDEEKAERLEAEQAEAEKRAKLESAKAKLTALGLDEDEVNALLGIEA